MKLFNKIIALSTFAALLLGFISGPCMAAAAKPLRLGYLDNPGSLLCKIAAAAGHFSEEGLQVELVSFADSASGLAALESGAIDVGAFAVGDSLRAIAAGKGFRIIAGGGAPLYGNPAAEESNLFQVEEESRGVVVVIPPNWPIAEKGTIIQLTAALIRAYRTSRNSLHVTALPTGSRPDSTFNFDPNPDYWRVEKIWNGLGLQNPAMKRDFLANHIYEEIYCDALDRLLLGDIDPVLQHLFSKAICTPNCCPANAAKL
ncbi:MAG: ABC transporter substrate-binding protein [Desulfuromonadaceae bacterium]